MKKQQNSIKKQLKSIQKIIFITIIWDLFWKNNAILTMQYKTTVKQLILIHNYVKLIIILEIFL